MALPRVSGPSVRVARRTLRRLHHAANGTTTRFAPGGTLGNCLEASKRSHDQAEIG